MGIVKNNHAVALKIGNFCIGVIKYPWVDPLLVWTGYPWFLKYFYFGVFDNGWRQLRVFWFAVAWKTK